MAWNRKYWDMMSNLFWTPRFLGFKSISRKRWEIADGRISIPLAEIGEKTDRLYWRKFGAEEFEKRLSYQEEILNRLFNFTFAIAGDAVVSKLLGEPLGIGDAGPFSSLGREVKLLYDLGEGFTQPDGFFVSEKSILGVELKLETTSSPGQILKYAALMLFEERRRKKAGEALPVNMGLLFIVPEDAMSGHWKNVGLTGPSIDRNFINRLGSELNGNKASRLFEEHREELLGILNRLKLNVVTWTALRDSILVAEGELDCSRVGDQTLHRLLSGFRTQIEGHRKNKNTNLVA